MREIGALALLCCSTFIAFVYPSKLWKMEKTSDGNFVVPYQVEGPYGYNHLTFVCLCITITDDYQRGVIRGAMESIEANTCIHYRERTIESTYLVIRNKYG